MFKMKFFEGSKKPKILCLGAHSDDIEIGCGGTILRIIKEVPEAQFRWVVFSGNKIRKKEALEGVSIFLSEIVSKKIDVHNFRESYFPFIGAEIKDCFEKIKKEFNPDLIFTHYKKDAHQDHKLISKLTWNTFRNHFIIEYEIPKYDGDLGTPNLYICLDEVIVKRKINYLYEAYQTQKKKPWFSEDSFRSILRIRGLESNSPTNYAEAFYNYKMVFK
ncbi:MAG: PIG-L family deacetylase [Candidatus Bathyarchaeota archaeon]|nr:PIG-L family deacetylase [Candidatus Bathyarchaeota archaeon]